MRLHFVDSHSPRNVTLSVNGVDPLYKISTPFKVVGRRSTICRIENTKLKDSSPGIKRETFKQIGEIEWQTLKPCKLRIADKDISVLEYFRKSGLRWGRRDRVFVAPDGKEYIWKFEGPVVELYTNYTNEDNSLVASYKPSTLGRWGPSPLSVLIIFPEWSHIADTIVLTFVYVESLRNS